MNTLKLYLVIMSVLVSHNISYSQKSIASPDKEAVLSLMKKNHVPILGISIIEGAQITDARVYGENKGEITENIFFNVASLTKPIITMLTLKLVSAGKWQLDEPLYHYWTDPDVVSDSRNLKLTTRHVLCHKSGLPNWRGHEPGGKLTFAFEPGSDWKYSGEGFEYLRQALEHKFNLPIEKLADSLIFNPIGMNNTKFYWDKSTDSSLYAGRYHEDGKPYEFETWYNANASNLVLSTVSDYAKFGISIMNGTGLSDEVRAEMIKTQAELKNNKEFGLGWVLLKGLSNGEYAMTHTGRNPGINTVMILLPQSKRGIIIFTNSDSGDKVYSELISKSIDIGKEILARMY